MEKTVIIINGKGGVGKDTLCEFAAKRYKCRNVSSITPIKEIARANGWNGEKDSKARKFLSDLKRLFIEYNDLPTEYLYHQYEEFMAGDEQIMFVHIREPEEIEKLRVRIPTSVITLLVERGTGASWGNVSDDEVTNYHYDYCYENDLPLTEADQDFLQFLDKIIDVE